MALTPQRTALIALFAGAGAIGFAPIFVRLCDVGPSTIAGYRLLFALPLLLVWMRRDPASTQTRPRTRRDVLQLIAAGILFVGDLAIWHWSLQFTSVANSTLLTNMAPLFVTLGAWLILGERIKPVFLLGLVCALVGATVLLRTSFDLSGPQLKGDILALIGAVFYAAYQLMVKHLRQRFSTSTIMSWSGVTACMGFFLLGWLSAEKMVPGSLRVWLILVALALICHIGGQTLIAYSLGPLPASLSSLVLLLQPAMSALLAWALLQERLGWEQFAGGCLILLGIALATRVLAGIKAVTKSP